MINRRDFLKLAAALSATFGISGMPEPVMAALKKIDPAAVPKIIYLQGLSCTGCSISLLQADSPSPLALITEYSQLAYHADLSAISGKKALDLVNKYISGQAGEYFLAVEGAIPEKMPEACVIGDKPFAEYLEAAAKTMSGAIAIGACACDGGIPAAEGNVTGAIGLKEFYSKRNIEKLVVNIRGWLGGTGIDQRLAQLCRAQSQSHVTQIRRPPGALASENVAGGAAAGRGVQRAAPNRIAGNHLRRAPAE